MIDFDEVFTETSALGTQVATALNDGGKRDAYKDGGMAWILMGALECLQNRNDEQVFIILAQVMVREPQSFHGNPKSICFLWVFL